MKLGLALGPKGRRLRSTLPAFDPSAGELRWTPPTLSSPTIIAVGTNFHQTSATAGTDYSFTPPGSIKTGTFQCTGEARRVSYIGGRDQWNPGGGSIANQFVGVTGSVYMEGRHIGLARSGDAITACGNTSGPFTTFPDIILQNLLIEGVNGSSAGTHADIYQQQGSVNTIKIDMLTGSSDFQGLFIRPEFPISGDIYLSRINLKYSGSDQNSYLLWLFNDASEYNASTHRIFLDEVYIEPREGKTLDDACWPNSGVATVGGALGSDESGEFFWWPNMPRVLDRFGTPGKVRVGPPPGGDFVSSMDVGIGYSTPGYQPHNV